MFTLLGAKVSEKTDATPPHPLGREDDRYNDEQSEDCSPMSTGTRIVKTTSRAQKQDPARDNMVHGEQGQRQWRSHAARPESEAHVSEGLVTKMGRGAASAGNLTKNEVFWAPNLAVDGVNDSPGSKMARVATKGNFPKNERVWRQTVSPESQEADSDSPGSKMARSAAAS